MTDTHPGCPDCRPFAQRGPDWCSTCQIAQHAEEEDARRLAWAEEAMHWKSQYELVESVKNAWIADYERAERERDEARDVARRLRARCEETDARFYASNIPRIAEFCEGVDWLKESEK